MKVKAMVTKIDTEKGIMIVFTKDKQFRRLPLPSEVPKLGSTILVSLPSERKLFSNMWNMKWMTAAVVVLVFAVTMFTNFALAPVSAYVTLDSMQSSLQIAVDEDGKVKEITPLNDEGRKIIQKLNLENKDVYLAVKDIVQQSQNAGYLNNQDKNLVMASVTKINESAAKISEEKLKEIIYNQMYSGKNSGYVIINDIDTEQWQRAKESGANINQLILTEKAQQNGIKIAPEKWKETTPMKVVNESQLSLPSMFKEDCYEVTWEERKGSAPLNSNYNNEQMKQQEDIKYNYQQQMNDNNHKQWTMDSKTSRNSDNEPNNDIVRDWKKENNENDGFRNIYNYQQQDSYKQPWNESMQNEEHQSYDSFRNTEERGFNSNATGHKW